MKDKQELFQQFVVLALAEVITTRTSYTVFRGRRPAKISAVSKSPVIDM